MGISIHYPETPSEPCRGSAHPPSPPHLLQRPPRSAATPVTSCSPPSWTCGATRSWRAGWAPRSSRAWAKGCSPTAWGQPQVTGSPTSAKTANGCSPTSTGAPRGTPRQASVDTAHELGHHLPGLGDRAATRWLGREPQLETRRPSWWDKRTCLTRAGTGATTLGFRRAHPHTQPHLPEHSTGDGNELRDAGRKSAQILNVHTQNPRTDLPPTEQVTVPTAFGSVLGGLALP